MQGFNNNITIIYFKISIFGTVPLQKLLIFICDSISSIIALLSCHVKCEIIIKIIAVGVIEVIASCKIVKIERTEVIEFHEVIDVIEVFEVFEVFEVVQVVEVID